VRSEIDPYMETRHNARSISQRIIDEGCCRLFIVFYVQSSRYDRNVSKRSV